MAEDEDEFETDTQCTYRYLVFERPLYNLCCRGTISFNELRLLQLILNKYSNQTGKWCTHSPRELAKWFETTPGTINRMWAKLLKLRLVEKRRPCYLFVPMFRVNMKHDCFGTDRPWEVYYEND